MGAAIGEVMAALVRGDAAAVCRELPKLLKSFMRQPLLYIAGPRRQSAADRRVTRPAASHSTGCWTTCRGWGC